MREAPATHGERQGWTDMPPPIEERSVYNDWQAIDHIPILACAVSPFAHLDKVPQEHIEGWALIWAEILEHFHASEDDASHCRSLKWMLLIHDIMLRLPPRGGRRGRDYVAQRFSAWQTGDKAKLVQWWERDRGAAHHPIQAQSRDDADRAVERALALIADGEIGRAARLLESQGLGDMSDERVVEQLRRKHPRRKE